MNKSIIIIDEETLSTYKDVMFNHLNRIIPELLNIPKWKGDNCGPVLRGMELLSAKYEHAVPRLALLSRKDVPLMVRRLRRSQRSVQIFYWVAGKNSVGLSRDLNTIFKERDWGWKEPYTEPFNAKAPDIPLNALGLAGESLAQLRVLKLIESPYGPLPEDYRDYTTIHTTCRATVWDPYNRSRSEPWLILEHHALRTTDWSKTSGMSADHDGDTTNPHIPSKSEVLLSELVKEPDSPWEVFWKHRNKLKILFPCICWLFASWPGFLVGWLIIVISQVLFWWVMKEDKEELEEPNETEKKEKDKDDV